MYFLKHKIMVLVIALAITAASKVQAAPPAWNVNSSDYEFNMTVTGIVEFDNNELADSNNIVAAFVGTQCRGVSKVNVKNVSNGKMLVFLTVYSKGQPNELVSFKVYMAQNDQVFDAIYKIRFINDQTPGSLDKPVVLSNKDHTPDFFLSSDTISEGRPVNTQIGTFSTADTNFTRYALVAGNGDSDNGSFIIKGNTLYSNAGFVYEDKNTYSVNVSVSDINGNSRTKNFQVRINKVQNSFAYNVVITPNGDGKNDFFQIKNVNLYSDNHLLILNEEGVVIFDKSPYQNDFDGTFNGKDLPTGAYYFLFKNNKDGSKYTGTLSLLR